MAVEILATGRAIPPRRVTNDDLALTIDTSDGWIRSHTGIGARHIAAEGLATSDLALEAARNALLLALERGLVGEKSLEELALTVDLVIVGSTTPDYYGCPATACLVQDRLGAKNAAALDQSAACSSFIYGLETAAGLLALDSGRKRALVIGAEILSRVTDWSDRSSCILFGDGAGAVLLEKTPAPSSGAGRRGLVRSVMGADGSGAESLLIRRGGSKFPFTEREAPGAVMKIEMDGQAVYKFAVKAVTGTIEKLLEREGLKIGDIDVIVPHQANARIVQAAGRRLNIPEDKFFLNIEEYANTSSASIPVALDELNRAGKLEKGMTVMTVGFGAGLTWGGNLIVW